MTAFRPTNVREFVALQLARRLDDTANLGAYLRLTRFLPLPDVRDVYRRVRRADDRLKDFWTEIERREHE